MSDKSKNTMRRGEKAFFAMADLYGGGGQALIGVIYPLFFLVEVIPSALVRAIGLAVKVRVAAFKLKEQVIFRPVLIRADIDIVDRDGDRGAIVDVRDVRHTDTKSMNIANR